MTRFSRPRKICLRDNRRLLKGPSSLYSRRLICESHDSEGAAAGASGLILRRNQIKLDRGQHTDSGDFREDLNAPGRIEFEDLAIVDSQPGHTLSPGRGCELSL